MTSSDEDDVEGFVMTGGGGGRSMGAWGRGGGVSRGRTTLGFAGPAGDTAGGGKLVPCFTSSGGIDDPGGFGAGTFLETRRRTLGFGDAALLLAGPNEGSDAGDAQADVGRLSPPETETQTVSG